MLERGFIHHAETGEYVVERFLGKGKSGYSYLSERGGVPFVLKVMHSEDVPYYTFGDNKVTLEARAYARLRELGVQVPELIEANPERNYLIKTYVDGEVATRGIADGQITPQDIQSLLALSHRLQAEGINLDWFPANFVLSRSGPIYIDYELNPFAAEWSFDQWGIWYWANFEGMREYLNTGYIGHLNADPNSGKPRQDEKASHRVGQWLG